MVRFQYEDRWGGALQWRPEFRGSTEVYGESIYTRRLEIIGSHAFDAEKNVELQWSYADHDQNSMYGDTPYLGRAKKRALPSFFGEKKTRRSIGLGGLAFVIYGMTIIRMPRLLLPILICPMNDMCQAYF